MYTELLYATHRSAHVVGGTIYRRGEAFFVGIPSSMMVEGRVLVPVKNDTKGEIRLLCEILCDQTPVSR